MAAAQGGQGSGHPPPAPPAGASPGTSMRWRPGSSIGRRSGGLTVAAWGLHRGSLSGGGLSLIRCSLFAPPPSVELEPLQLLPTPYNRQTPIPAPVQQPRGQRGKGRAEPPGERGELRFSAPSRPNCARERVLRQLLAGSCFARPFGRAPAKNSSGSRAGALPNGP
jgi:hypothetical protein